jgi:hypothetical protein
MPTQNRLEELIGAVVADPALHARWLNTFSYLEYVGFRKIVKSQRAEVLTAAILGHACEEGRHALGLKKLAVKLGGAEFDSYASEVLRGGGGLFSGPRQGLRRGLRGPLRCRARKTHYCYVTWLVERSALDVYGIYKKALADSDIARKLGGLLAEETKHLAEVEALLHTGDPEFSTRSKEFEAVAAALHENFVDALARELARDAAIAAAVSA